MCMLNFAASPVSFLVMPTHCRKYAAYNRQCCLLLRQEGSPREQVNGKFHTGSAALLSLSSLNALSF